VPHAERLRPRRRFYDVVVGMWRQAGRGRARWLRDKASGTYIDRDKIHFLDHVGAHFKVKGR